MQSRRDQAQAQSYLLGRLAGALVAAEPDGLETPHRRTVTGLGIGALVAVLAVAGSTVYGLIVPGGATAWRDPGSLVVEKETGSRYVYVDGRLRPVPNYASARLLLGDDLSVTMVSAKSLAGTPHGAPIGIADAPDTLPATGLGQARWTVCTGDSATTLAIGSGDSGSPVGGGAALLVRAGDDDYLIWQGRRHRLGADWLARVLGFTGAGVEVPQRWLDLVPAGADLAPLEIPGRGEGGPEVDGERSEVGQLFSSKHRYYVLLRDGLSPLSPLAYTLLAADPAGIDGDATPLSPAALAALPVADAPAPAGLPTEAPVPVDPAAGDSWCLRIAADGTAALLPGPAPTGAVTVAPDRKVVVETGLGGLVITGSGYSLITDAGIRYPVADAGTAEALGYPVEAAAGVPPGVLDLLPVGPPLSRLAASSAPAPVPGTAGDGSSTKETR